MGNGKMQADLGKSCPKHNHVVREGSIILLRPEIAPQRVTEALLLPNTKGWETKHSQA